MVERDRPTRRKRNRRDPRRRGRDEAGLWAGDLYRMLTRYGERRGFKTETMSATEGAYTFEVRVTALFRVQVRGRHAPRPARPETEKSQGRIHTSTATVAVLPEAEDVDIHVDRRTSRSTSTARRVRRPVSQHDRLGGADHAQATRSRVMQDEKSQRRTASAPMKVLESAALEAKLAAQQAEQDRCALRPGRDGREGGEDPQPTTSPNGASPTTASSTRAHLDQLLRASSTSSPAALQDDEKRRRWTPLPPARRRLARHAPPLAQTPIRDAPTRP